MKPNIKDLRVNDDMSFIRVFKDNIRRPLFVLEYNPADKLLASYIKKMRDGLTAIEEQYKNGEIDQLEYAGSMGEVYEENLDAIFGKGSARMISRYDTSDNDQLINDIMDELKTGLDAYYKDMDAKAKEKMTQAVIDARKEGSSYIAPQ